MTLGGIFDIENQKKRIAELEKKASEPKFWDDQKSAQIVLKETKHLKTIVESLELQAQKLNDAELFHTMALEEPDPDSLQEAALLCDGIESVIADLEFTQMLSEPDDAGGAVVEINSGAGGIDAADWAEMLMRLLTRYSVRKNWKVDIVDYQVFEDVGVKSVTLVIEGQYAYGFLKAETGVHRLVRHSPFDQNSRRHTSFAAVSVTPDVEEDQDNEIKDVDLRLDVFRAGGAGGQHVNKTESAVRITHIPTNIVVQCQSERSQHKNKAQAMRVLRSRLYERKRQEQLEKNAEEAKNKKKIEWGSQIRSYVLTPYQLVTDHRTEMKAGNVEAVLDGEIDEFIRAYLLALKQPIT